jgi:hypothetical protein
MTDRRDPEKRASQQAARQRLELKVLRPLVEEQRRELCLIRLAEWFEDPTDFERYDDFTNAIGADGRIDYGALEKRAHDLLARKPGFARRNTP